MRRTRADWAACRIAPLLLLYTLSVTGAAPRVAIIMDDLGNSLALGQRVIALPGAITCAFLPQTPYARALAEAAHQQGKEVMLHLPMEADAPLALGSGALRVTISSLTLAATLAEDLASVPYVVGVNNHMGSRLTRQVDIMTWLMQELNRRDLYFIDSRTSPLTVAAFTAQTEGVATALRDVFLDAKPGAIAWRHAFKQLLDLARRRGAAIAIAHPYPTTLVLLEQVLPHLQESGVTLLPASQLTSIHGLALENRAAAIPNRNNKLPIARPATRVAKKQRR